MKFRTIKTYQLHKLGIDGKIKIVEIPKDTLVTRSEITETNPGMEYITLDFGDEDPHYISAEIVEWLPDYFEPIEESDFLKIVLKKELKDAVTEIGETTGVTPLELVKMINEIFSLGLNLQGINRSSLEESRRSFMEELERVSKLTKPDFTPHKQTGGKLTYPSHFGEKSKSLCSCGNDGSKPCFSVDCPMRLITVCYTDPTPSQDPKVAEVYTIKIPLGLDLKRKSTTLAEASEVAHKINSEGCKGGGTCDECKCS